MKSKIAEALRLIHPPFAIIWTDEKPRPAQEFKPGKWGCVMWMLASVVRGKTAVFSRETFGCWGGGIGLGFGDQYLNFPGGPECFYYFLSVMAESISTSWGNLFGYYGVPLRFYLRGPLFCHLQKVSPILGR